MSILELAVPIGLGDLIYIKAMLDSVKFRYSQIRIMFHRGLIADFRGNNPEYHTLLDDIGKLFFSEPPYILTTSGGIFRGPMRISTDESMPLQKPELGHLLCKGTPLNLDGEYIVLTTKVRYLSKAKLNAISKELWSTINSLYNKYKIVILGERVVEMNSEYIHHTSEHIYSIYDDIINNVPASKLLDLTIPALGITTSNLQQIQQDCLIMKNAKFVMTLGVGGNFSMATAVANTIGYRADQHDIFEVIYNREYSNAIVTKDFARFISALKQYL